MWRLPLGSAVIDVPVECLGDLAGLGPVESVLACLHADIPPAAFDPLLVAVEKHEALLARLLGLHPG